MALVVYDGSMDCRASEDRVPGAMFCRTCFRYKLEENQCVDFVYGNVKLKRQYQTKKGITKWELDRETT